VDVIAYKSIIKSLRYLANTHPDLAFVIEYVKEPWEDHLAVVKRILRYVVDTSNWGL
jgi:hypothetical protein